jgi:hypothetical protein
MNLTLTAVRRSLVAASFAASFAAMSAGTASAQVVDINGGSSWSGWSSISNSQTAGVWVRGRTDRTFNIFRTQFTLNASQSVGGSRLADGSVGDGVGYSGDDASSLFTGAWQAGDRIIGVGIQYTGSTRGTTAYLHVDARGDNIFGASSFGAGDGVFSHDAGDTSAYNTSMFWNPGRWRTKQYSVWSAFSQEGSPQEGNYSFPYGQSPTLAMPTRTYAVLDNGSIDRSTSVQMFMNLDAILRSNGGATYGDDLFYSAGTKIGFFEADESNSYTDSTNQIFAIPAPGALALLGLAGAFAGRRRR